MVEIKNSQEFAALVNQGKPVLADFYADWCGPCQMLMPVLDQLAEQYADDVVIAKINVDQNQELARMMQVRGVPALFLIKDGELVDRLLGVQSFHTLGKHIEALKAA